MKSLDKLKRTLLEILRGKCIFDDESTEFNFLHDGFVVSLEDAIALKKDCGLFYCEWSNESSLPIQNEEWRDVAKFVLALVGGIEEIEQQNDKSTGTKIPPVLPHDLIQLRSYEFNEIVSEQTKQYMSMKTPVDLQFVQEHHCE